MTGNKANQTSFKPGNPGGPGAKPWDPTTEQRENIKTLAGRGVPEKMIAAIVGVDKLTLRKHCAKELQDGRAYAVANVLGSLYKQAIAGEYKPAQLYLANTIGWRLTHKVEHAGRIDTGRLERGKARAEAAARAAAGLPPLEPAPDEDGDDGEDGEDE